MYRLLDFVSGVFFFFFFIVFFFFKQKTAYEIVDCDWSSDVCSSDLDEYSILATMNLNGDYLSDAAAAIVGGLGMGPGANIGDTCAIFEATHGTAPKHADRKSVV